MVAAWRGADLTFLVVAHIVADKTIAYVGSQLMQALGKGVNILAFPLQQMQHKTHSRLAPDAWQLSELA